MYDVVRFSIDKFKSRACMHASSKLNCITNKCTTAFTLHKRK